MGWGKAGIHSHNDAVLGGKQRGWNLGLGLDQTGTGPDALMRAGWNFENDAKKGKGSDFKCCHWFIGPIDSSRLPGFRCSVLALGFMTLSLGF